MRHTLRPLLRALVRTVLSIGAALALAPPAYAATTITSFQVTATVLGACSVATPATLAFGSYDAAALTPLDATTTLAVTCTTGTAYSVGLSAGNGAGATATNRVMTSATAAAGNNTLTYGLFKDNAHLVNWDNSVSGTGNTGTGVPQAMTVYGQLAAGQFAAAPATNYTDTITVTLTY